MHLYFAVGMLCGGRILEIYNRVRPSISKPLLTYAYPNTLPTIELHLNGQGGGRKEPVRLLIDSGAFTAWTVGTPVHPEEYAEWALAAQRQWEPHVASMGFFNLDVIGNQPATWRHQTILERLGMNPIPIVTYGSEPEDLERGLTYPWMALGGLVPLKEAELRPWLDRCFAVVAKRYQATGVLPRVHILGVTKPWVFERYPCYSADSSTWTNTMRFGTPMDLGSTVKRVPHAKAGDTEKLINAFVLRRKISYYRRMESHATELWARRGVIFHE